MLESKIIKKGDNFKFSINGKEYPPVAYITYFEENNDYEKFSNIGFKLYSVTVSTANKPINAGTGFKPFTKGVFDVKESPDFSSINEAFDKILTACPDAYIFPRVYVTMPDWWIEENETEVIETVATGKREALYSEKFRKDAAVFLKELINYIENSKYADKVFAYHVSGGNTQEWFHLDLNGGYCENALKYFNKYLSGRNLPVAEKLPDLKECESYCEIKDETLKRYLEFSNESVADTVEFFCKTAKEALNYKKIVGSFYGYNLEVMNPLWGTHKLSKLLDSKNIDFLSSPNSYNGLRSLGYDWGDMMPNESIKLHGKLPFMENDIRTHLTKYPEDSRKGCDPKRIYNVPVFKGPASEELSVSAVNKSFLRQITHNNGMWWFDMFGHWYNSERLLNAARNSIKAYEKLNGEDFEFKAEVAVFIDETISVNYGNRSKLYSYPNVIRDVMINCGIPFDIYLMNDFEIVKDKYKASVFISGKKSPLIKNAVETYGKPYITFNEDTESLTDKAVIKFLKENNIHIYHEQGDIIYLGNGYLAIHARSEGEKLIKFPKKVKVTDEFSTEKICDRLMVYMEKFETKYFKIS